MFAAVFPPPALSIITGRAADRRQGMYKKQVANMLMNGGFGMEFSPI